MEYGTDLQSAPYIVKIAFTSSTLRYRATRRSASRLKGGSARIQSNNRFKHQHCLSVAESEGMKHPVDNVQKGLRGRWVPNGAP